MNRQKGIVIGVGAVLALACAGIGVFFVLVLMRSQEAKSKRDTAFQDLEKFYKAKIFPNDKNIAQTHDDQATLEAWYESVSNQLAKSEIPLTELSPPVFLQNLENDIREMMRQTNAQGRPARVAAEFRFGFDRYKEGKPPDRSEVPRLNQQLDIIKLLVHELNEANILKLEGIAREVFEGGDSATAESGGGGPGRVRNKDKVQGGGGGAVTAGPVQSDAMNPVLADLFDCQRFTVVFHAYPDTLVDVLNRLSAMSLFVAVSDMELKKTGESLPRDRVKKETAAAKPGEQPLDPTPVPAANRTVTNPELEPPVSVRLSLDVYSFKGV